MNARPKARPFTGTTVKCLMCERAVYVQPHQMAFKKCCSSACRDKSQQKCKAKICVQCSQPFDYSYGNKDVRFCSKKCWANNQKMGVIGICRNCKNDMYIPKWNTTKIYCSRKCKDLDLAKFQPRLNTAPERKVKKIFRSLRIGYRVNFPLTHKGRTKYYDIFIPKLNLLVEVDGVYWHGKNLKFREMNNMQKKNRKNDLLKNRIAKMQDYTLVRIWEDEITIETVRRLTCVPSV